MRELSIEDCETCQRSADSLEDIFDQGGSNKGGQATPDPDIPVEAVVDPSGNGAEVTIVYKYEPQVIVRESGADPEKYPAERMKKEFVLKRGGMGGEWSVSNLTSCVHTRVASRIVARMLRRSVRTEPGNE